MKYKNYIGVFDSGTGGLTVLKELVSILPNENFIYYGDTKNCPYGNKSEYEIISLTIKAIDYLIDNGVKAIVVACNTATSAAINYIRDKYKDKIIIGIEPALKPAVLKHKNKKILVMATSSTIKLDKFKALEESLKNEATIIPVACPGLAESIENKKDVTKLLHKYLDNYTDISAVVLGCTHYPLIKKEITDILGNVEFFDGSLGVAKNLKVNLEKNNLLNTTKEKGKLEFISTKKDIDYAKIYNEIFK